MIKFPPIKHYNTAKFLFKLIITFRLPNPYRLDESISNFRVEFFI